MLPDLGVKWLNVDFLAASEQSVLSLKPAACCSTFKGRSKGGITQQCRKVGSTEPAQTIPEQHKCLPSSVSLKTSFLWPHFFLVCCHGSLNQNYDEKSSIIQTPDMPITGPEMTFSGSRLTSIQSMATDSDPIHKNTSVISTD